MRKEFFQEFIAKYKVILFFLIVISISWSLWIPMALNEMNIINFELPIIIGQSIGGISPLITLIILDKISGGNINLKEILNSIRIRRIKKSWLIISALSFPLLTIAGNIFNFWLGSESQLQILQSGLLELLGLGLIGIIPLLFFAALLSSPFFEEPGWRGFAINNLQMKFGRHLGSLLLGSYWWLWHVPINIANGLEVSLYSYLLMVMHSFTIDSLYNLSNKNLLSAMFSHSSLIVVNVFIYSGTNNIYVLIMFLFTIITLRVYEWKRRDQKPKINEISDLKKENKLLDLEL